MLVCPIQLLLDTSRPIPFAPFLLPNHSQNYKNMPRSAPPYALNHRQWAYVQEFFVDRNGTKAAERAGYSAKSAGSMAAQLMANPKIQAAIEAEQEKLYAKLEATRHQVMDELQAIAFLNIGDYGEWLNDGTFLFKDGFEVSHELKRAIKSIERIESFNKDGDLRGVRIKVQFWDKLQALKMLGQIKVPELRDKNAAAPAQNGPTTVNVQINQVITDYQDAISGALKVVEELPPKSMDVGEVTAELESGEAVSTP